MKTLSLLLLASAIATAQSDQPPSHSMMVGFARPAVPEGSTPAPTCAAVSPEPTKLEFDAASVRLANSGRVSLMSGGPGTNDPGRVSAGRIPLEVLIADAYDSQHDQIKGPEWLSTVYLTIGATMPETTTKDQYCGMLRNLLTERFHLAFHHETQTRPGYELTVMPGGVKFSEYTPEPGDSADEPSSAWPHGRDAQDFFTIPSGVKFFTASSATDGGPEKLSFRGTMDQFANRIDSLLYQLNGMSGARARVANHTGLNGIYDIRVEYAAPPGPLRASARNDTTQISADPGPALFNAVEKQLGLKLQKGNDVPVDVLVLDHVDQRPSEN